MKLAVAATVSILIGISVLTFPSAAKWWSAHTQQRDIARHSLMLSDDVEKKYQTALARNIAGDYSGAMQEMVVENSDSIGSVEVPAVNIMVPVYPTSSDRDLERGAGHLEETSAPVGGLGTHSALSAHTGMPTATMFDNLHKVSEGDTILLHVLGQTLHYSVVDIVVDTPQDGGARLQAQSDRDLLTLVTCTPYGVNTHRLLVTAQRDETNEVSTAVSMPLVTRAKPILPVWPVLFGLSSSAAVVLAVFGGLWLTLNSMTVDVRRANNHLGSQTPWTTNTSFGGP